MFRSSNFSGTPVVVKNLIIINVLLLLSTILAAQFFRLDLNRILGMFYFRADLFKPYQLITHMFMHGGFIHLFFNMFMLWMFGRILENIWGPKRFFIFYITCGLGAAILHTAVNWVQIQLWLNQYAQQVGPDQLTNVYNSIPPVVGASGAVYGILLGFGVLFPNTPMYIWFIPIPIKAKFVITGLIIMELYLGIQNSAGDNIAHFAHLGGALFGYLLIRYWRKNSNQFY